MGKVIMSGIVPQLSAPVTGIPASELAVGSTVKLNENGSPVEYLVVHNGLPSSMYDASCDGLWLLRKDIYEKRQWHNSRVNKYADSTIHSYLNSDFLGIFDNVVQGVIQQAKIPYVGGTVNSVSTLETGSNGLSTKVFLLAAIEVGFDKTYNASITGDGVKLEYFKLDGQDGAENIRIAKFNGSASMWFTRSPNNSNKTDTMTVSNTGTVSAINPVETVVGIRPAIILPSNAIFDEETLILKGVS